MRLRGASGSAAWVSQGVIRGPITASSHLPGASNQTSGFPAPAWRRPQASSRRGFRLPPRRGAGTRSTGPISDPAGAGRRRRRAGRAAVSRARSGSPHHATALRALGSVSRDPAVGPRSPRATSPATPREARVPAPIPRRGVRLCFPPAGGGWVTWPPPPGRREDSWSSSSSPEAAQPTSLASRPAADSSGKSSRRAVAAPGPPLASLLPRSSRPAARYAPLAAGWGPGDRVLLGLHHPAERGRRPALRPGAFRWRRTGSPGGERQSSRSAGPTARPEDPFGTAPGVLGPTGASPPPSGGDTWFHPGGRPCCAHKKGGRRRAEQMRRAARESRG